MTRGAKSLTACAALAACAILPGGTKATNIFDTRSTCTAPNCEALTLNGTISATDVGVADPSLMPWTVQVFARANECLRLDVISQGIDLQMVVIAPNGRTYSNDDKGDPDCEFCPRVAVATTPSPGWYTVHVTPSQGVPVRSNFGLRYGLYNRGNPNCGDATRAVRVLSDRMPKLGDGAGGPAFDDSAPPVEWRGWPR